MAPLKCVCFLLSVYVYLLIRLQYLSPERARGLPHDTRKADIWSLGVTFFEILVGRTPFEHTEGEPFTTKAALEDYWARTVWLLCVA
jgi:serine/threonine protein kinase